MTIIYLLINLLAIVTISVAIWKGTDPAVRSHFFFGLGFRLAGGIALGLIYTFYYTGEGDTFLFFDDAVRLSQAARGGSYNFFDLFFTEVPAVTLTNDQPRSIFFVSVVGCINFLTGDNYWLTSLWLSLFSFAGSWYLICRIVKSIPDARMLASVSFLFFPSVVLWSSGVVKESLAFGGLCFLAGFFLALHERHAVKLGDFLMAALSAYLLLNLKYYWGAVFFPAMLAGIIVGRIPGQMQWCSRKTWGSWLAIFLLISLGVSQLHPNFYWQNLLVVIKENHDAFVELSLGTLYIQFYQLSATWSSMIVNAPWALLSGLFRPFLFEAGNPMQILAGVENVLLLVLFLFQLSRLKLPTGRERIAFISTLMYVVVLCIFLALSSPNFGTLSRYRIGFLPFFVFLLLMNSPLRGKSFRKIINRATHLR